MPRVLSASLGRWVDPAVAYRAICGDSDSAFWLDSGQGATTGTSYIGIASETRTEFDRPVLDWLRDSLASEQVDSSDAPPGFTLGWVGWLGYELRGETMAMPVARPSRYPDAAWLRIERALAFDHSTGLVTLMALDDAEAWRAEVLDALARAAPLPVAQAAVGDVTWAHQDDEYLEMIAQCQQAIVEGDAYLLCLTTEVRVGGSPDPVATYLALRESSPTHHGALLRAGGVSLLSASPEQFLTVDLMRNDIGRVSKPGTVGVVGLLDVESYAQVHQLVSTVRGELADGLTGVDAIAACFPAGSMTGAPKLSATTILDRLERRPRGIYSGAFGYVGFDGAVDLAMVIRSIIIDQDGATIGTGGGITALSVPEEELAETKLKAAALLAALGLPAS